MIDFDIKRVEEVLELYGSEVVKNMQDYLSFTENLKNSITSEVINAELIVKMPYYATFVENGRKKGAPMPPSEPIEKWMKAKGIPIEALWPIRKKIKENGIVAKPFFHYFTDKIDKLYTDCAAALEGDALEFIISNSNGSVKNTTV